MVTGIKSLGVDLDSIFEVRSTAKIGNVNIKSNGGIDISNRFENINSGSGPSATGIKDGGTDLNLRFAELGSVSTPPEVSAQANGQVVTTEGTGGTINAGVRFNTNGTEYEVTQTTGNYDVSQGTWLDVGASSDVWVEFTKTGGTGFWNVLDPQGRQVCSGSPSWKMYRVSIGQSQVIGYFKFYDAASGGNTLQTTSTVEWSCERTEAIAVSPSGNGQISGVAGLGGNVFAGVKFDNNGTEYECTLSTGNHDVSQGAWLDAGAAGDVWVQFVKTGGTGFWNHLDPGTGRLRLSTDRLWRMYRVSIGSSQIIGYFRMYDAASGGNLLWTGPTATWEAFRI